MNQDDSKSQLRDDMIDALLRAAYQTDSQRDQDSIKRVLQQLDSELPDSKLVDSELVESKLVESKLTDWASATPTSSLTGRPRRRNKWMSWAIAASAMIAIGLSFQFLGQSGNAMANAMDSVDRCLAAAQELVARHYRITVTTENGSGNTRHVSSDLYVQGANQFALRHPALIRNNEIWLGSDGAESWIVPSIGPIRVGDQTGLGKWLANRESLSTPILHVETILARMKQDYHLKQQSDETLTLDDGTPVVCQHIVGILHLKDPSRDKIELWCDKQSGVAIRMDAVFNHRESSIVFVGSPDLSDDWFTPAGHHRGFRRTLRFDSPE